MKRGIFGGCALALIVALTPSAAATLTFNLSQEFSGGTPPAGPGPWLRAEFNDVSGGVRLTLTGFLRPNEFVTTWTFNLDPSFAPNSLKFARLSGPSATVLTGVNAFTAGGSGLYDVNFRFPSGPPAQRFNGADVSTYLITSTKPISAAAFDFLSLPHGGHGPFKTAAHVQGIGPCDQSGWVTVPEPSALTGLALAAGLLAARRRVM
ncbi:MAG: PEP-CTERM sorting domain-containing protein [Phycisphaerae bacterium]